MYTISDYLLDILKYLRVTDVVGVPGDYNLNFLDHLEERTDLTWRGNLNELNAAYLADGYARKNGFSALVTTFGVGELSALNGLTGSQAERVPVLEIVGTPATTTQQTRQLVHHSLPHQDFSFSQQIHQNLGIITGQITVNNAITEINRVIQAMLQTKQPGYLQLPVNLANLQVNPVFKTRIPTLIAGETKPETPPLTLLNDICQQLNTAQHPVLIIGSAVERFHLKNVVQKFITKHQLPFVDLNESKGVIDENIPQFIGTYTGNISTPAVQQFMQQADLCLALGPILSDVTTGGFTQTFANYNTILLTPQEINFLGEQRFPANPENFTATIKALCQRPNVCPQAGPTNPFQLTPLPSGQQQPLTEDFYRQALETFVQTGDTLVVEHGTSLFALENNRLPGDNCYICQSLWAAIGYTLPAALGASLANRQHRVILSIGEGSILLSLQELVFAIKNQLKPLIFILDNQGYTIERVIQGLTASYNDVPQLNYQTLLPAFGATAKTAQFFDVKTNAELISVLKKLQPANQPLTIVQLRLEKTDAPANLKKFSKLIKKNNQK
ncbi:alpha-keto acid decarboxylase family protein [Fructilactobacillus florum]|uniref:alpha-keto acid decarboxylase family protein n=1 Tax=Fructilactobacillus florum TaxID=640331 RepID=UPI00028C4E02|nr:thiamine pyrophosphate-binding protein [Fructilactobacillus florum]EKK21020.1 Pyruvate decarboxylase [Fructilactobacillus florum 2F]